MITESFLNSCFTLILNKNSNVKKSKALYRDILEIITSWEKKETVDIPLSIKTKLDLLNKICAYLVKDKTIDNIIDSVSFSEKFKQHNAFLDLKVNEEIKDHVIQDIIKQVRLRKKINALFANYDQLSDVLDSIKDGSFDSIDDLVEDYEVTIKTLYSNMMEANRAVTIEAAASLDLVKDDYKHVLNMIKKKYERKNTTSTGFDVFDNDVMFGGYEPSRLYIFGGGSGAGKSTILNNTIYKSATRSLSTQPGVKPIKKGEIRKVYVYVSLENTIEEALMRTYMPMFDKTIPQMLTDISNNVDIKKMVIQEFAKSGSTVMMKYFPAMSVSVIDLHGVVDDAINEYGKDAIAGLYVDYIDLLKADTKYDLYRLELGHITLSLKTLAVQYNIPVVTASQLGRQAYRIQTAHELGVDMMSESIKKVEHADFVMLLAKDLTEKHLVHGKVGKNRSGKSGDSIDFDVDFERFKFRRMRPVKNKKKPDSTGSSPMSFPGNVV